MTKKELERQLQTTKLSLAAYKAHNTRLRKKLGLNKTHRRKTATAC